MARGQQPVPKTEEDAGDTKASKRRCVQSACVPCRKRKSKVSCSNVPSVDAMGSQRSADATHAAQLSL